MNTTRTDRRRGSERGEGTLRLVVFLGLLGYAGFLAIQNLPVYFAVQNCKHDLAELARGTGVIKMPVERVTPQAVQILKDHEVDPNAVKVTQTPNGGIQIAFNTI